jgi:hypothetical protein
MSRLPCSIGPFRLAAMNMPCVVFFGIASAIPLSAQIQRLTRTGTIITGAPYSATQTAEHIQTLADGTHITRPGQKGFMYRDSAGRTRNEFAYPAPIGAPPAPTGVIIFDPVAGFRYQLDSREKVARRFPTSQPDSGTAPRCYSRPICRAADLYSLRRANAAPFG